MLMRVEQINRQTNNLSRNPCAKARIAVRDFIQISQIPAIGFQPVVDDFQPDIASSGKGRR